MIPVNFYIPNKIELLFDFFGEFNIKTNEPYIRERKDKVLNSIKIMLLQNVIYVGKYDENKKFETWNTPVEEIISKLDKIWTENMQFSEFYDMVWFGYKKWYLERLVKESYESTMDWKWFIENKIGNIERWIEENKPE